MYNSAAEAKKDHWFSRRHQTSDAHQAAKDKRERHRDEQRARAGTPPAKRSPFDQYQRLNARLGAGVGATKERARLTAQFSAKVA